MMKRIVSAATALALGAGCLLASAAAAKKEEEQLRAVEEVVRHYRTEEAEQYSSAEQNQPVHQEAPAAADNEEDKPETAEQVQPAPQAESAAVPAQQQAVLPAPQTGQQNAAASQPLPSEPPSAQTQKTQEKLSESAEINIWQQLAEHSDTEVQSKPEAAKPISPAPKTVSPPPQTEVGQQNAAAPQQLSSAENAEKNPQQEYSPPTRRENNGWQQSAAGAGQMSPLASAQIQSAQQQIGQPFSQPTQNQMPAAVFAVPTKDDITVTIEEAVRQYRANDFAGAISNLDYAAQLIRQKKSERLKALLPRPMFGWLAKDAAAKFLGTAVFGGGSTVSRDYYTNGGAVISIEIVSDSPVLQSIIMMLNNPLFAGASGGNIQAVKGQRAIIKYDSSNRSGEINIVVDSRFIVTVKGISVEMTMLLAYAEAVDFDTLAKN